jgi:aldehyde:ferredoxin oxidoreductase
MACIINERRAAGRKGFGAVMGSKNLKAIAIQGTGTVDIASEQRLKRALKIMPKGMKDSPVLYPFFSKYGTSRGVNNHSGKGIFPAKNWTATGEFAPQEKLWFEAPLPQKVGQTSCAGCPVGYGQLNLAKTGDYAGILAEGPEYETVYAYGGQTGVDDLDPSKSLGNYSIGMKDLAFPSINDPTRIDQTFFTKIARNDQESSIMHFGIRSCDTIHWDHYVIIMSNCSHNGGQHASLRCHASDNE